MYLSRPFEQLGEFRFGTLLCRGFQSFFLRPERHLVHLLMGGKEGGGEDGRGDGVTSGYCHVKKDEEDGDGMVTGFCYVLLCIVV